MDKKSLRSEKPPLRFVLLGNFKILSSALGGLTAGVFGERAADGYDRELHCLA